MASGIGTSLRASSSFGGIGAGCFGFGLLGAGDARIAASCCGGAAGNARIASIISASCCGFVFAMSCGAGSARIAVSCWGFVFAICCGCGAGNARIAASCCGFVFAASWCGAGNARIAVSCWAFVFAMSCWCGAGNARIAVSCCGFVFAMSCWCGAGNARIAVSCCGFVFAVSCGCGASNAGIAASCCGFVSEVCGAGNAGSAVSCWAFLSVAMFVGDGTTSVSSTSIAFGVSGAWAGWGSTAWDGLAIFAGTEAGGGMLGVFAVSRAKILFKSSKSWVPGRRRDAWTSLGAARSRAARPFSSFAKSSGPGSAGASF